MSNRLSAGEASNQQMKGLVAAVAAAIETEPPAASGPLKKRPKMSSDQPSLPPPSRGAPVKDVAKARARRLEQNRRAAIESRRRKKVMLDELQRSVAFYTKANANLKLQNEDLERRIILARQQMLRNDFKEPIPGKDAVSTDANDVKCGQSDVVPANPISSHGDPEAEKAQLTATRALYQTMGYPPGAAKEAANTFSQFVGLTGNTPTITLPPAPESLIKSAENGEEPDEESSDAYIHALNQFAMEQAAAANAAAAAANAALQAVRWHKTRKAAGEVSRPGKNPSFNDPPEVQSQYHPNEPFVHALPSVPQPSFPPDKPFSYSKSSD